MNSFLLTIITILVTIVGYFVKKTYDKTESISSDVADMKPKVDILWKDKIAPALSPRQLNERGETILDQSGIKEIIDEKLIYLRDLIKSKKTENPYDAEMVITEITSKIPEYCPESVDKLKEGAFKVGTDIGTVLFVGSIYLRNKIFPDLNFKLEDLDKPRG